VIADAGTIYSREVLRVFGIRMSSAQGAITTDDTVPPRDECSNEKSSAKTGAFDSIDLAVSDRRITADFSVR